VSGANLHLTDTVQDHLIVVLSKPEPRAPKLIQFGSQGLDQGPPLGETVDTDSQNHIDAESAGNLDGVTIVHEQTFRREFQFQPESVALSGVQPGAAEFRGLRIVTQMPHVHPVSLCRDNMACDWKLHAIDGDLLKNRRGNRDLTEERPEQIEVLDRSEINKGTAIGDGQSRLPGPASSLKFFDSLAACFPVVNGVSHVGNAALLEQIHELKPAQSKISRGMTSRNFAVRKQCQDCFLAHAFLKFVLVDRAFGEVS